MGRGRDELRIDAASVSTRPADRPALIRTTDLPAERLPPVDVLAVERDPARVPSGAGNDHGLNAPWTPTLSTPRSRISLRRPSAERAAPGRHAAVAPARTIALFKVNFIDIIVLPMDPGRAILSV